MPILRVSEKVDVGSICDSTRLLHVDSTDVNEGAVHVPTISWHSGRPSLVSIVILLR